MLGSGKELIAGGKSVSELATRTWVGVTEKGPRREGWMGHMASG